MRIAVCQCSDTGPLESLAVMLRSVNYQCYTLSQSLCRYLISLGCDTVSTVEQTMRREGVEKPFQLPEADLGVLDRADLYVDVKAQRNAEKVWRAHPRLRDRTLWYRINGGEPTHSPGYGDERNLVCPVLTPNLWYRTPGPWSGRAYSCWPPFHRFDDYYPVHGRLPLGTDYGLPVCLVHNLRGWGYGAWADGSRRLGLRIHGRGSPDGLINHQLLPRMLSTAVAMVHLKQSDSPGYALYEAMAAACPLVVSQRLVCNNLMEELLVEGETCLLFDRMDSPPLTHGGGTVEQIEESVQEISRQLDQLRDPAVNARIGVAGRNRLSSLMWREDRNGSGLLDWMSRMFPLESEA